MKTIFFGAAVEETALPAFGPVSSGFKDHLILFGAILVVVAAILIGVFLSRRSRSKNKSHGRYRRHRRKFTQEAAKGVAEIKQYVEHRKERSGGRRRRREHRPRNPTLAETGGLPPIRPEDPPSSPNPPY